MRVVALAGLLMAGLLAGCSSPESVSNENVVEARTDVHHGERFTPTDLTVGVGDAVTFRVVSGAHTVDFEQEDGVSSPHQSELSPGSEVMVKFTKPGVYAYYCQYHLPGMKGAVTVE